MARQSYTKNLKIEVDTSELKDLKNQLDLLQKEKLELATKELLTLDETDPQDLERINELREAIEKFTNEMESIETKDLTKDLKKKFKEIGSDIADAAKDFFIDIFKSALDRIQDIASYDLANTRVFNRQAYDQAMRYGITDPSMNYALTQAMEEFNLRSEEDMMLGAYDREAFAGRIGYYSGRYNELANKDFFRTVQDFSAEWKNFKTEMEFSLIEFFMQNKDLIKNVMIKGIEFMKVMLTMIDGILSFLAIGRSDYEKQAALSNIMQSYSTQQTTNNVSISNTLNPSSQMITDKSMLDRASELSYAQIIKVLEG